MDIHKPPNRKSTVTILKPVASSQRDCPRNHNPGQRLAPIGTRKESRMYFYPLLSPYRFFPLTEQDLPATLLRLILLCAGDIETNPGPKVYLCSVCSVQITRGTTSVLCRCCHEWVHLRCSGLTSVSEYQSSFECPKCLTPSTSTCPPNNNMGQNSGLVP